MHSTTHHRSTSSASAITAAHSNLHQRYPSTAASSCSLRLHEQNPLRLHPPTPEPPRSALSLYEHTFDDIHLAAPSHAFTRTNTGYSPEAPSPLEDFGYSRFGHQRSLTDAFLDNCRPLVQRAASTIQQKAGAHSPTKSLASFISLRSSAIPEDDKERDLNPHSPTKRNPKLLQNLFNGASAPINIGLVPSQTPRHAQSDEEEEYEDEDEMFTSSAKASMHRKMTSQSSNSKFSWLIPSVNAKVTQSPSPPPSRQEYCSDELLTLNIQHTLFPHGPSDPLDPASFNDLLTAADSLIQRYQNAYRSQAAEINELRSEQSVQDEELDEAETRARHLKIQLDDMAARAAEQDRAMQALKKELEQERTLRIAEEEARLRSTTLASKYGHVDESGFSSPRLSWAPRDRKRVSNSSVSVSDSGFESESEGPASSAASVANIDAPLSPPFYSINSALATGTSTTLGSLQAATPQEAVAVPMTKARGPGAAPALALSGAPRSSAYEKLVLRVGGGKKPEEAMPLADPNQQGAWNVVRNVREENAMLRSRISELEDAVDGALTLLYR